MTKITAEKIKTLTATVHAEYAEEVEKLMGPKPGLSKKQAADLLAGHQDGVRNMIVALRTQGFIEVTE
jgi:hypothetical protein